MRYLLLGYDSPSKQATPVLSFIGDKDECFQEKDKDGDCMRYEFFSLAVPDIQKFADRPVKKQAKKQAKKST